MLEEAENPPNCLEDIVHSSFQDPGVEGSWSGEQTAVIPGPRACGLMSYPRFRCARLEITNPPRSERKCADKLSLVLSNTQQATLNSTCKIIIQFTLELNLQEIGLYPNGFHQMCHISNLNYFRIRKK